MRPSLFLLALALCARAQIATQVNGADLPNIVVGFGPELDRGTVHPYSIDATVAVHIGTTQFYSWTAIATPLARGAAGSGPVASVLSTGGAWIPAQSANGVVKLVFIVTVGIPAGSAGAVQPSYSGNLGAAIRLGKSNWSLMPYFKAAGAAGASAILQPGLQLQYKFGGK